MSDDQAKYLDMFPGWLRTLGDDAEKMVGLLTVDGFTDAAKESVVGGLNYLFKSLDLIPDGIDDIGFLDDAFVLRVSADLAAREEMPDVDADALRALGELANDCEVIRGFLGEDYQRLEGYVRGLRRGAARGRSVTDIMADEELREELTSDVRGWSKTYEAPSFAREEKNLIKLRAFFDAKLPR